MEGPIREGRKEGPRREGRKKEGVYKYSFFFLHKITKLWLSTIEAYNVGLGLVVKNEPHELS